MTMEFRLGDDDGVDGVGSNGACTAFWEADLAPVAQARKALAGGCTVGENVPGISEFAADPVVADPLLVSMAGGVPDGLARLRNDAPWGNLSLARLPPSRMASASRCTGGVNFCGTSKFAAAPVVTDPLLVSMAGGVPHGLARLRHDIPCGNLSLARLPPSRMASAGGCTVGENVTQWCK